MKRKYLLIFIILSNLFILSAEERIKQYQLDSGYEIDRKILQSFGNLWAFYTYADSIIVNGSERKPIETISFYYKSNNNFYYLGKYNKFGIYNKNQNLLFSNPYSKSFIGYTEDILEDPFYTGQYAVEENFGPGAFESYVKIEIDFQNKSIAVK